MLSHQSSITPQLNTTFIDLGPRDYEIRKAVMSKTVMSKSAPILQLLILLTITTAAHAEIYRVIDADGKVTFTDQPPANSDDLIETIPDTDPKQNITPSPASLAENQPEWLKEAQEKRAQAAKNQQREQHSQQQKNRQDWKRALKAAKADVKEAELMLEIGREPTHGDFVGNAGGGARPSSAFLKRLTLLEKNLADANRRLLKVQRSKPK